MRKQSLDFLKELLSTPSPSGYEADNQRIWCDYARKIADEVHTDAYGNAVAVLNPEGSPKIMLDGHVDEIGLIVKHIDDKGFLRLQNVGGFDTRNLHARRVLVQGKRDLTGLLNPAGPPVHVLKPEDRKKVYEIKEFYVDLMLPAKRVKELVRVGDPVTLAQTTEPLGDAITGKAMDNRVASYVALEAIRRVKQAGGSKHRICYAATVQEEVGCRGAAPAAFGVEPDVAVAIDVTLACDTPGVSDEDKICRFGGGAAIKIMDGHSISNRQIVDEWIALAKRKKIDYQLEVLPMGGTDAGAMQRARQGFKAITLSVPCRYVHTITESVHKKDLEAAIKLLAAYLQS